MGVAAILVMWPGPFEMFENVDGRTTDDGWTDAGVAGILLANPWGFGSGELKNTPAHEILVLIFFNKKRRLRRVCTTSQSPNSLCCSHSRQVEILASLGSCAYMFDKWVSISFALFDSLRPINNLSVMYGWVFLGWTSNVSCSRTQHIDTGVARTRSPSVLSQALYYWATALPHAISNKISWIGPINQLYTNGFFLLVWYMQLSLDSPLFISRGVRL